MSSSTSLNTGQSARDIQYGVVQYLTKTVAFNTLGVGTADTVLVGTLPAGAQVTQVIVRVVAGFNAATTNVLTVGIATTDNNFIGAGDIDETVTGTTISYTAAQFAFAADTPIYVRYTQTGTAATAGSAVITIAFIATANG